jgi:hypothetical protein
LKQELTFKTPNNHNRQPNQWKGASQMRKPTFSNEAPSCGPSVDPKAVVVVDAEEIAED